LHATIQSEIELAKTAFAARHVGLPSEPREGDYPETAALLEAVAAAAPSPALQALGLKWLKDVQKTITEAAMHASNAARAGVEAQSVEARRDLDLQFEEAASQIRWLEAERDGAREAVDAAHAEAVDASRQSPAPKDAARRREIAQLRRDLDAARRRRAMPETKPALKRGSSRLSTHPGPRRAW
jgi:hypothetical protein